MSRPSKPKPPVTPAQTLPVTPPVTPPVTDAASTAQDQATDATKPESTLGDGDAKKAVAQTETVSAAPDASAPDVVNAKGHVLRVVGPARGRWRAGRKFGPEPVEIAVSDLSDEDLLKLHGDPELICAVIGEA